MLALRGEKATLLAENFRDAIAAKQQALAAMDQALHTESVILKVLQRMLDTAQKDGSTQLTCLVTAKQNTTSAIQSLQESREALAMSIEMLEATVAGLREHYKRQGIDSNTLRDTPPRGPTLDPQSHRNRF